jgi:hypothetical protein
MHVLSTERDSKNFVSARTNSKRRRFKNPGLLDSGHGPSSSHMHRICIALVRSMNSRFLIASYPHDEIVDVVECSPLFLSLSFLQSSHRPQPSTHPISPCPRSQSKVCRWLRLNNRLTQAPAPPPTVLSAANSPACWGSASPCMIDLPLCLR